MGKNKLAKFADMATYRHVLQYPFARLQLEPFPLKGKWQSDFFGNDNPIVVELGCGRGEYTVGLAKREGGQNFIGIDVKGARMWHGATEALREGMVNVAFIRGEIEMITHFFAPEEVSELWITFADPQMKKVSKRLTSSRFLSRYQEILSQTGSIHLKTDSPFLYAYTKALVELNGLTIYRDTTDLYAEEQEGSVASEIQTYYEEQWRKRGMTIKYLHFSPWRSDGKPLEEPDVELEPDDYRSYGRHRRTDLDGKN